MAEIKNHKWKAEKEYEIFSKPHVCLRCGVRKTWYGGEYKRWNYRWNYSMPAQNGGTYIGTVETFDRPSCETPLPNPYQSNSKQSTIQSNP